MVAIVKHIITSRSTGPERMGDRVDVIDRTTETLYVHCKESRIHPSNITGRNVAHSNTRLNPFPELDGKPRHFGTTVTHLTHNTAEETGLYIARKL
jgi:hypothetical protein